MSSYNVFSLFYDAFTKNDTVNGNGALDNPVGLLTADEYTWAGNGYHGYSSSSYLNTGQNQWSLAPYFFGSYGVDGFLLGSEGRLNDDSVDREIGVRPAVSLKPGTKVTGDGDGSAGKPYVIE